MAEGYGSGITLADVMAQQRMAPGPPVMVGPPPVPAEANYPRATIGPMLSRMAAWPQAAAPAPVAAPPAGLPSNFPSVVTGPVQTPLLGFFQDQLGSTLADQAARPPAAGARASAPVSTSAAPAAAVMAPAARGAGEKAVQPSASKAQPEGANSADRWINSMLATGLSYGNIAKMMAVTPRVPAHEHLAGQVLNIAGAQHAQSIAGLDPNKPADRARLDKANAELMQTLLPLTIGAGVYTGQTQRALYGGQGMLAP